MTGELKRIKEEAWKIITDPRARRLERLEAMKLICAAKGILLPDLDERFLTVRQVFQVRQAKQSLIAKALDRKEKKARANKRHYIRRKIKTLEGQQVVQDTQEGISNGE